MCVCPGASPPVMEIPSSRREVRVCFPGTRSAYQVTEVLPSRQLCVVLVSGGFTTGYRDAVFMTGGADMLSVHAFRLTGYRGTAFQAAACGACLRGLHPSYGGTVFQTGGAGVLLGHAFAYPVTEVPSFRRRVDGLLLKMFCLKCQNWDFVLIFVV